MNLAEKIAKVEALLAGATTEGERKAASRARDRLRKKTDTATQEYSVRVDSHWKKKLFVAICRKHGYQTYRYRGQKHTTTMLQVSKTAMDEVLWPEFKQFGDMFEELAKEIMDELIGKIYHGDVEETVIAGKLAHSKN